MRDLVCLLLGMIMIVGCQNASQVAEVAHQEQQPTQQIPQTSAPGPQQASNQDPVEQLKSLIRPDAATLSWRIDDSDMYFEKKLAPDGIKFDVRKTDSLVSPFTGEIRISVFTQCYKSNGAEGISSNDTYVRKYNYQGGQWVPSDLRISVDSKGQSFELKNEIFFPEYDGVIRRFLVR